MDFGRYRTNSRMFVFGTLLGVFFAIILFRSMPLYAATGINQKINFQGRLLNSAGATVPDGFYNMQFKIYQDGDGLSVGNTTGAPSGTLKWTESYLNNNSQGVKVLNGFMTVALGSVTPFGSSIDWNQDTLWLSANIGSTNLTCTPFTSCTPDGEMIPMQPLTTAVYALNAMQLGGLTASSFGQLAANQTWTGVNTYRPVADATNVFQLQKSSTGIGYITGDSTNTQLVLGTASSLTGKLAFGTVGGGTLTVNPTSSASSFTITLPAETGTVCTTASAGVCSVAGSGFVQLAPLAVQTDNTTNVSIFINKTNATGNILELQKSGSDVFTVANTGNITASGTYNTNTFTSTALTFAGASPVLSVSTTNTGLTVQANGTGTLALNTTGAGTVSLGTANSTTINIGNSASANAVLGTTTINTSGTAATTIGNVGATVAIASSGLNVTTAGVVSGVTTLGLSGAITGATATNTINGIVINSQAVSSVTTLGLSGAITGATATNTINGLVINAGALTSVTGITTNGGYVQSGSTANTLTGATTLSGNLIVTGAASVAVQKGTDFSTTGTSTAASFTGSLIRLTGASTQTIQGITGAADGRIITLVNTAGQAAIIANQNNGATAAERIVTGTSADISLAPDASLELRYDTTTSRWRVVSGSGSGANVSLSNLSGVAINTSLLPASNNSINLGSNAFAFASGFFGTNVQAPLFNTFDQTAASTASTAISLRSGNASGSGAGSSTGAVTIKSGDSTNGNSGAISLDAGSANSGTTGSIAIGATNSTVIGLGNTGANTQTSVLGGSGASAILISQGLGGTVTIGTNGSASTVNVVCGSSTTCGFANNATDHSTTIGSTTGTSVTTLRGGSGGLTLTGNITASGTYNTNTFTSTALTFAGANPVLSASTTNTGLTVQANGSGTLTLNTTGAGTVNLGTASTTTLGIGNASSTNTILGATGLTGTTTINGTGTAATTIGAGTGTAGNVIIQGGAGSSFSATNTSGTSIVTFAAPSTAGIVTYQLPNGGTGGNTYGICTTFVVCSGYGASGGANTALSNLAAVAINTSLLPASNNTINIGSTTLAFASGYFGTNLQSPLLNTFDQTAGSTNSTAIVVRSGAASGATSDSGAATFQSGNASRNTGAITIASGNSTTSGNSGAISIDAGSVTSGTGGAITVGTTNSRSISIGNTTAATQTLIQGGTGGTAVSIQAGTSGAINIGTTNVNSVSIGSTTNTSSLTFGQSAAGETINIGSGATAAATTVSILSGVGTAGIATLNLGNNTRVTGINLGNINPAAARTIAIGNTSGTGNGFVDTINIATNPTTVAGGNTVNIATGTPTGSGTNLVTIGSTVNASTTVIQGGTGSDAIQLNQATGAGIIIGNANTGSTVSVQCGAGTSSLCGFGNNANDHTTTIGSTSTASSTVIQSGTSGITLTGNISASGTYNTNTFTASSLTFAGANPVISASTTNTGVTLQSNGTGTLTLNSGGVGTVNVGTTNTTTIGVGNTTAATQTLIQGGNTATALGLQVASGGTISVGTTIQTTTLNIGNTSASTVTNITGGTTTSALNAQVGNGGSINIGTTAQTSVQNIGNTSASTLTLINGGTSATAIQVVQGTGGTITVGGTGAASNVIVQCGAGATSCNFGTNATDHTTTIGSTTTASATIIQAGTSGISLTESTTVAANKSLTLASGTGRYIQTFTGTTTDAASITASGLTTGAVLLVTSSNNSASATSWNGVQFNATNAQGTTAASNLFGADFQFTQSATIAGNTEAVANFAIAASGGSPTDNTVDTIVNIANNDTAIGNLVNATNGIRISATTASNIINAINLDGTFQTNLITTSTNNYTVTNGGAVTQAGNLTLSGTSPVMIQATASNGTLNIQANGTGAVAIDTTGAGTVSLGATNAATVNVGGAAATNVSVSCAASAVTCNFGANTTDHTTNLGSSTGTSLTSIQGGTAGITLTSGATVASILSAGMNVRTSTNSATAFRVQNTGSNAVVTVDTSTPAFKVFAGAGGSNYIGLTYNDGTSTGTLAASVGTTAVGSGTGAISVLAGSGSAITITGNATSLWRTTAGTLTMQSGTSSDLILTSGSGIVQISGSSVVRLGASAGDPGTCTAGAIVYNTSTNTLRGCQGSSLAWNDLVNVTTPTLQATYTASTGGTTPEIKLDTTRAALDIQGDNAGSVTTLLNVRAGTGSGLGTAVFSITSAGTTTMQDATGVDLLTADSTNGLIQIGSAAGHSADPIQLVLDNYQSATAGAEPTVINGAMYYDADSNQFRCAASGFWSSCGINSIQSSYVFEDEFLSGNANSTVGTSVGGVGDLNWNVTSTTSCTESYNQNVGPGYLHDHPGVLRLTTGAANGNGCAMTQGGTGVGTVGTLSQLLDVGDSFKSNIAITAATGTIRTGWMNTTSNTAPTSGAYWQYTGGNLQYCYANNAAATCATATAMAANAWAEVEIHINSITSGSMSITFVTNIAGTTTSNTTTANFDAGITNKLGLGFTCFASTTTAQSCLVDYIQWSGYNTLGDSIRD